MSGERPDDLMQLCPPQPPYFDAERGAWIFSRYADIMAALHNPCLEPEAYAPGAAKATVRARTQEKLSTTRLREWQSQIEPLACNLVNSLEMHRPVDLVREFAEPWCATLACLVTGADAQDPRLLELARCVSAAAADPHNVAAKTAASAANQELERRIPTDSIPMATATFVALAHTLPGLLANMWLALLRHPEELTRLRNDTALVPAAMEELLRFAGLARAFSRVAAETVTLAGATIQRGQKVILLLNSANRDPASFSEPNRVDVTRRSAGHLAFGAGPHSCVAASLIRMAVTIATTVFLRRFQHVEVREPVEWRGGTGFRAPAALYVENRCPDSAAE